MLNEIFVEVVKTKLRSVFRFCPFGGEEYPVGDWNEIEMGSLSHIARRRSTMKSNLQITQFQMRYNIRPEPREYGSMDEGVDKEEHNLQNGNKIE